MKDKAPRLWKEDMWGRKDTHQTCYTPFVNYKRRGHEVVETHSDKYYHGLLLCSETNSM